MTEPRPLYTPHDFARLLSVDVQAIYRLRTAGKLPPAIRVGQRLWWRPETIDDWLTALESGERPEPETQPETEALPNQPTNRKADEEHRIGRAC
ncbi:helix-turn-helix transcriptional regulator [Gordonia neofelifaecis]|uniref:Helix-turn-helix domain-containing protein n=1 Tax=Gordonia neofelifaecis NRRL B-59395 TaxID=644548 RepID=F1YEB6_9ACTN|nr:helix-turn-helix domain-containing protein [Gordonia neofelifaecis]EGD56749.1 hypothetical protein SCNU_00185 [Gordonia neofelifaecis NRRL B-59395]